MATITKKNVRNADQYGGVPYGNMTKKHFSMTTDSSGVFTDSNDATAIAIADVIRLGILPAGMKLIDSLTVISDAFTAATTADIGFAYVDGTDSTSVPQDADYFNNSLAMSSASRTRAANTAVRPVTLPKDAYLILTWADAAVDEAGTVDVIVEGELIGAP